MGEIKSLFNKFEGVNLIKQYAKAGVLPFAIVAAPVLGLSRKGLELFRLAIQMKIYQKISRCYATVLKEFDEGTDWENKEKKHLRRIWICWFQGMDSAPLVVKKCYKSICKYLKDFEIIVLTSESIGEYVILPEHILEKWKTGIITNTHFSDLLRLAVLNEYGGTWLDATVLCTGGNIPSYMLESDLFFYQVLKPGRDGSTLNISSWLLTASSNSKILNSVQHLLYEYWRNNNSMVDYFLIHIFMELACNYYKNEYNEVIKFCNSMPHVLLLEMFEQYNEEKFKAIKAITPFHKLAYKREQRDIERLGTYFDVIINQENF